MAATYKRTVGKRTVGKRTVGKRGTVTWSTVVDLGTDPATGKRRQKRISGRTRKEAERHAAEAIHRAETGFFDAKNLTVATFLDQWLDAITPTIRSSSLRRYRDTVRLHITAHIGGVKLSRLTPGDVQRLYATLLERLQGTTVLCVHSLLHHALDDAVRWGIVVRNVTDAVDPPRPERTEMQTWSLAETSRFLAAVRGHGLEALFHLALTTGMRRGELLGLKWADIDLDASALSVRRTLSRSGIGGQLVETEPKTATSRRRITLPASTLDAMRRHRTAQLEHRLSIGPAYVDRDYVFADSTGDPMNPNTLRRRFRDLAAAANVPPIRFHDLRHTSATILLSQGVHPKIVQERLGHADISMTLGRYSHVTADIQQVAADAFDSALDRAV